MAGNADAHTNARHKHRSGPHRVAKSAHPQRAERGEARATKQRSAPNPLVVPLPVKRPALADLPPALSAVRQALELLERGKFGDAAALEKAIDDPAARKLVEWALLRRADEREKANEADR